MRRGLIHVKAIPLTSADCGFDKPPMSPMPELIIEPLRPDQIRLLYPLLREQETSVELDAWISFARRVISNPKRMSEGIIVASWAPRKFPCGMVCYRRDNDMELGAVLTAEHFIAVDLLNSSRVLTAMAVELDRIAADLGCAAVRSIIHSEDGELIGRLTDAGHRPQALAFFKKLKNAEPDSPAPTNDAMTK